LYKYYVPFGRYL